MQCIIICAGKGTRMMPLTECTPKPLIPVCGKPLLQHVVEALPDTIDELILVVGYLQEQIREYCGEVYFGKKVTYVTQEDYAGGTGDALMCAKGLVHGKFMCMYADDIHGPEALQKASGHEYAILGTHSDTPEYFGVLVENEEGTLKGIIEKPQDPPSNIVNIGGFILDESIFTYTVEKNVEHDELFLTDMVTAFAEDHPMQIISQDLWVPVGKPEDIQKAEAILCPEK
ncbi:MAG: NDP-sugar pyrophosphorylase family protein [Acidimicrobiales bacterium]|jgi:NDP-sugar pyrophosphorylase family protein